MTIINLDKKQLEKKIGKITPEIEEKITLFGTPIEKITSNEISVEIFPNRPDLLSFQGFSRALYNFLKKPILKNYKVEKSKSNYKVIINKSVKEVRPFTYCAIVKNLRLDKEKIIEIIDLQEKLHASYGRNRKKLAIGIYPLDKITFPVKFLAKKPEEIKFQPLDSNKIMTGRQILYQNLAGRKYKELLNNCRVFPIFQDSKGEILSMPPIINSKKTGRIDIKTKEIFIECSGFNREYLKKTLNIIVCVLADFGGKIYPVEILDKKRIISPDLKEIKLGFSIKNLNKVLGLNLPETKIKFLLSKMGINCKKNKAIIPPYRVDILHEVDLFEEVAIAYGYNNFSSLIPKISTIGGESQFRISKRKIRKILIGLGLLEISTYHLSTKEKQFKNMNIKDFKNKIIELINSKTENNILRTSLLAQSIDVLSKNSDASYPQKIFELGKIFEREEGKETKIKIKEKQNLCVSLCSEKANFTALKQILDYLFRMFNKNYDLKETQHPSFIDGRTAEILVNNKPIGIFGEIKPFILKNNKIKMPTAILEINLDFLKD